MAYDNRDCWVSALCPSLGSLKNTVFRKLDLSQYSDERVGGAGVGHTNGNTTDTLHISLLILC
jgi:hypothetical protein